MKALKAVYWFAFVLDVITTIIWLLAAETLFTLIPATLTIWIFIIHLQSYKQIKLHGFVSLKLIRWQSALGVSIAVAFSFTIFMLSDLDCFDACTNPPNHWLTTALPLAATCLLVALGLVFLPYILNRNLMPKPKKHSIKRVFFSGY